MVKIRSRNRDKIGLDKVLDDCYKYNLNLTQIFMDVLQLYRQGIEKKSTEQLQKDLLQAKARMEQARKDYNDMCSCGKGVKAWVKAIFEPSPPLMKHTVMGRVIDEAYGDIQLIEEELARRNATQS